MENLTRQEYISRINKVFDFIESNYSREISLEELAEVAHFSKFHFTGIFAAGVGETPFKFIQRVRLEKAATFLLLYPKESVSEIATKTGFNDLAIFSRNFKIQFGVSPSVYRLERIKISNISQTARNQKQTDSGFGNYFCRQFEPLKTETMELNKSVEVKNLPAMSLAYLRYIGPYQGNENLFEQLWNKLFGWAGPRGLIGGPDFKSLIIYHDDPNITDDGKLRLSVCITVPKETKPDGEIGRMELEEATYAIGRFEVTAADFSTAWGWFYGTWLPQSGYVPDDKPCFEMYPEEPKDGKFIVDICVPVKPL